MSDLPAKEATRDRAAARPDATVRPGDGAYRQRSGQTLGLRTFEKISAIEGVSLTHEMREDLAHIERAGMDERERTRFIIERYGRR